MSKPIANARRARATLRRWPIRGRLPTPEPSRAPGGIAFEDGEVVRGRSAARAEPTRSRFRWHLPATRDRDGACLLQQPLRGRAAACRAKHHRPRRLGRRPRRTGCDRSVPASESDSVVPPHRRRRARSSDRRRRASGPAVSAPRHFRRGGGLWRRSHDHFCLRRLLEPGPSLRPPICSPSVCAQVNGRCLLDALDDLSRSRGDHLPGVDGVRCPGISPRPCVTGARSPGIMWDRGDRYAQPSG